MLESTNQSRALWETLVQRVKTWRWESSVYMEVMSPRLQSALLISLLTLWLRYWLSKPWSQWSPLTSIMLANKTMFVMRVVQEVLREQYASRPRKPAVGHFQCCCFEAPFYFQCSRAHTHNDQTFACARPPGWIVGLWASVGPVGMKERLFPELSRERQSLPQILTTQPLNMFLNSSPFPSEFSFSFPTELCCPPTSSSRQHSSPLGSVHVRVLWSPIEWQSLDENTPGQFCWCHPHTGLVTAPLT